MPAVQEKPEPPKVEEAKQSLTINGRVLGPAGKPIAGARLYSRHELKDQPPLREDIRVIQRTTTSADGRFALKLPDREFQPSHAVTLIAVADGFGLDWIELPQKNQLGDVTLRLAKDAPIRGRILRVDGKPVPGVTFNVTGVSVPADRDRFLKALPRDWLVAELLLTKNMYGSMGQVLRITPSDNHGRFEIAGVGADRWVGLEMIQDTIAHSHVIVMTHEGLDLNAITETYAKHRRYSVPVYGPFFEHVAEPRRVIEGTVREAVSGRPVAGVSVHAEGHTFANRPVTDARGHYRFLGLPKSPQHTLGFTPPTNTPLMGRSVRITVADGSLNPMQADVELPRGVIFTGRVFDRVTGKGVLTRLHFYALPGNPFANQASQELSLVTATDDEGRFRFVTIPGPGVLAGETMIRWTGRNAGVRPYLESIYKPGKFPRAGSACSGWTARRARAEVKDYNLPLAAK